MPSPDSVLETQAAKSRTDRLLERLTGTPLGRLVVRFRWLVPLVSFIIGIGSYFLIQRQNSLAQWLTALMLLGWVALLFEGLLCRVLAYIIGERMPQILVRYAAQALHQETLFFALPFFLATTTWLSTQLVFTGLLVIAAFASVIDPVYYDVIARRRPLFFAYHAFTMFAALLTAGPIIGSMTTGDTIAIASGVMAVAALPSFSDVLRVRHWSRWFILVGLSVALGSTAWLTRFWIPPATLDAKHMVITTQLNRAERKPGPDHAHFTVSEIQADGLYAFSAIKAPRGLHQQVLHIWRHNGQVTDRIPLAITGGRKAGYRAWTHISHFGEHPSGNWRVTVVTDEGQLIGVKRFTVSRANSENSR